jgi:hypothetical protein
MVPFHLPSITLSVTSMGHGEISFFETPAGLLPLTTLSVLLFASVPIQRRLKARSQQESLMHLFNIATVFFVITLVGVEFSVSAFVNPAAWRLEPESQLKMLSRLASVLGKVMPVWYPVCTLFFGIQTWLHWRTSGSEILVIADAVWLLVSAASIIFLVPLNSRVAEGVADWQRLHRTWDKRHRVRIAALALAAILLTDVVVR